MANVLLTWELGAGLGHLMRLKSIAEWLTGQGHAVTLVARDLRRAEAIYADTNCQVVQAPFKKGKYQGGFEPPSSFGHVLFNTCFGDTDELGERVRNWQELYREVNPSLVIFDHSPTALLAARSFDFKRATIGTGFCCPPPTHPLPVLRTWQPPEDSQLRQDEGRTLDNVNAVSAAIGQRPLDTLGELYADVEDVLLATFEELDHFPERANGEYLGAWPQDTGKLPEWPNGYGPRIFAYLKRFQALPKLIEHLAQLRMPTIVYSHGIDDYLSEYCTANYPSIRFETQPLNLRRASEECDLAILNGTHGTTAAMLLAGKPILFFPIHLEQRMTAERVARLGAGVVVEPHSADSISPAMHQVLVDEALRENARRFSRQYAESSPELASERIFNRIAGLLRS